MPSETIRFGIVLPNDNITQKEVENYLQDFIDNHQNISQFSVTATSMELNKTNMVMYCKMKAEGKYDYLTLQDDFDDRYTDYTMFLLEYPESKSTRHKVIRIIEIVGSGASIFLFTYAMYQLAQIHHPT